MAHCALVPMQCTIHSKHGYRGECITSHRVEGRGLRVLGGWQVHVASAFWGSRTCVTIGCVSVLERHGYVPEGAACVTSPPYHLPQGSILFAHSSHVVPHPHLRSSCHVPRAVSYSHRPRGPPLIHILHAPHTACSARHALPAAPPSPARLTCPARCLQLGHPTSHAWRLKHLGS